MVWWFLFRVTTIIHSLILMTHFPVVTSPHQLILHGVGIKYSDNVYFKTRTFVGIPLIFNGVLLDYFDKPTDMTEF